MYRSEKGAARGDAGVCYLGGMESQPGRHRLRAPTLERLRDAAHCVAASNADVRLIVLFGSIARRESTPGDVDLGILSRGDVDLIDLTNQFVRTLELSALDLVDLRRANPVLLMAVARDGIPLFDRTGIAFGEFSSLAMRRYADTKKFRDAVRDDLRSYAADASRAHDTP